MVLDMTPLWVGAHALQVVTVADEAGLMRGLSTVDALPEHMGMLFDLGSESWRSFTLAQTRIPLDVIFLDRSRRVVEIFDAVPARAPQPVQPRFAYRYALETVAHWTRRRGIRTGALARW